MEKDFKIVLSGNKYYREIYLNDETKQIFVGNMDGCDILLDLGSVEMPFYILISQNEDKQWELSCCDSVYISDEGVIKQLNRLLVHGDNFAIKYNCNNVEILRFSFVINFDNKKQDYHKIIDIASTTKDEITIGGYENHDICIDDELMQDSEFSLVKNGDLYVDNIRCVYGLYINGNLVKNRTKLQESDFITVLGYNFYFRDGVLKTTENGKVYVNGLPCTVENVTYGNLHYPRIYRNTRIVSKQNKDKITILLPPEELKKPQQNIIKNLLPAIVMLILTVVIRGYMGGGGTFVIFSVCTMSMGIGTTIASFLGERKAYKVGKREREEKYNKYIQKKKHEIEIARQEEKEYLEKLYYTPQQEYMLVRDFSSKLFGCKVDDQDFLHLNLGIGKIESIRKIEYKEQEQLEIKDELTLIPEKLAGEYKYIKDVPIICDLVNDNVVGIVGDDFHKQEIVKNIIVDICVRHYYTDVRVIIISDEKNSEYIKWARFIPHLNNEFSRNIVCNEESKNSTFEYMYKILSEREDYKLKVPHYVVIVLDDMGIKSHPVSKYIEKSMDYGFSFIFFEEYEDRLPMGCKKIIRFDTNKRFGELIDSKDGNNKLEFEYSSISDSQAKEIAIKLSPVYTEEISLESSLVKNITIFDLLGISNVKKLNLYERWGNSITEQSLAAPLGINAKNDIVYLDLHEKAHGPHGLVAGTTGSGKSEILQSYILSMSTLYHPYEVSFMIIDFKGGGMVNQFRNLPHLIGAITNIDGKEIDRSLKSIKAELKRRQRCFAEVGVNHIDQYIKKTKVNETPEIIPHLIVIVDEFAELKAEQPEFMKELISAARIGRSLGVHLILATQKPAGQVNEQIWSNSKFKLCLKVQNKEDSNEVIKSPLAAEIREPGRAYLQVGNNEIFELFQSAYSGAPADANAVEIKKEFSLSKVELSGKREVIYQQKNPKTEEKVVNQLKAIVDYVEEYCYQMGIARLPSICMPPLPELVQYEQICIPNGDYKIPIGIYDDPDNQYQGLAYIDVMQNNTAVIGSSQYGKTYFILNIVRYITEHYTPEQCIFYVLDFGSRVLTVFETINHCGGVVCAGQDEKFHNLIKFLIAEINIRKEKFLNVGVTSYGAYRDAGNTDLPLIILIVDNFTALRELYLNDKDVFMIICRDGATVGITITITNSMTSGIGFRYLSNFANKIAFYCNDQNEYNSLFDYCKERPTAIPGRCLVEISKKRYECQTPIAFEGEKEIERANAMKTYIEQINSLSSTKAKLIPVIPPILFWDNLLELCKKDEPDFIPIGLDYNTVGPVYLNMHEELMLTIVGRDKAGKTNFIGNIIEFCEKNKDKYEVHILDEMRRKLKWADNYQCVESYNILSNSISEVINDIYTKLQYRYDKIMSGGQDENFHNKLLVLIINNLDAINSLATDKDTLSKYKEIITRFKNLGIHFIFAQVPNATISYSASDVMKSIKDNKNYIAFEDIGLVKITEISPTIANSFKKPIELGDAYYIKNASIKKIKTAKGYLA